MTSGGAPPTHECAHSEIFSHPTLNFMSTSSTSSPYLKTRVYRVTKSYVCLLGAVLAWVNLNGFSSQFSFPNITFSEWVASCTTVLATTAVAALGALPGERLKAALVFWRWKHPLPGSRAFEQSSLTADHRISIESLRAHVNGKFPRGAQDQNAMWYRLYKTVQYESEVTGPHYEYLLFRDLAWFTGVVVVVTAISIAVNTERWRELAVFGGVALVVFCLLARAGAERGYRFVRTVLAVVAARPTNNDAKTTEQSRT
jgi:hypothetical protein